VTDVFALQIALGPGNNYSWEYITPRLGKTTGNLLATPMAQPSLEPDPVTLTDEISVDYESDISLTAPINWIYAPNYKSGHDLPFRYGEKSFGGCNKD
jgi:hypothetical protein